MIYELSIPWMLPAKTTHSQALFTVGLQMHPQIRRVLKDSYHTDFMFGRGKELCAPR